MFYLIINAQIVFFMQAGFCMLEVGIVNPKNAKSILFKNMLDGLMVTLGWWLYGFGLAGSGASGQSEASADGLGTFGLEGGVPMVDSAAFIHSLVFATTTTTIMSGGVAERMKVEVYIYLSFILSSLVYSNIVRWSWTDDGFLAGE
jgi:Amt family ammonium transporter